jgi:large subunit ribosomal protein L39
MNKNISTPYNVAQHFNETLMNNAVLALINGNINWDVHRPLQESCTLQLLNFRIHDPFYVNMAFWKSCSFILGAVLNRVFKDNAGLLLHSFPYPHVRSGSFVHDFSLKDGNFKPTEQELKTIAIEMMKFATENHRFERLDVPHNIALEIFKDNPFKREQLPSISNKNNGIVSLYRIGEHIDISKGPMIASSNFIQRIRITAVHKVSKEEDLCNLYRIQGIALPTGFRMSYYAFENILGGRAKKLVIKSGIFHLLSYKLSIFLLLFLE